MVPARTLADRLASVRTPSPTVRHVPAADDRVARLARWFDARTDLAEGGTVLVVERSVAVPRGTAEALSGLPSGAYFDTETTGLSTGAGTVIFLAGIARVDGDRIHARQYLLPDFPYEPPLLRAVARDLATSPRIVTYNGRGFDLPMLAARLTFHGLFREQGDAPRRP